MTCRLRTVTFSIAALALALAVSPPRAEDLRPGQIFRDCDDCPEMVVIPAGSFEMGASETPPRGDGRPSTGRRISIKNPYALGRTEVTRRQWRAVMGVHPIGGLNCDDCPVEHLSWHDAQDFVRALSTRTGKPYRLPSEAEWEYACRAGSRNEFCGGEHPDDVAWHEGNSGGSAHPVAGKLPNAFGLYDMSGNAWEWTADCWHTNAAGTPADGSPWVSAGCPSRVIRGGSWQYRAEHQGAAVRAGSTADELGRSDGLRVARPLP